MEKLVLRVPEWQGELVFSEETLIFVGVILLMVVGSLFCFWGYKYFGTILLMGIGIATCYGCYLLVEPMTDNPVIIMFLTVSLTFWGLCFVYFLSIIWGFILDKMRIRTALAKRNYLLAAPVGAAILGLTIYYMIWRDEIVAGAIAAVCLVTGLIYQHSKRNKQVRFRSYNDLLRLSRPQFDADEGNAVAVAAAGMTAAVAIAGSEYDEAGYEMSESAETGYEMPEYDEAGYEMSESVEADYEMPEYDEAGYEMSESVEAGYEM
ncbi:MAG: hypothetical protein K2I96_13760, partial [Lachnospiraceae bacterium]|nr:hypothetical protein [Lachnospiraceae bacterium]